MDPDGPRWRGLCPIRLELPEVFRYALQHLVRGLVVLLLLQVPHHRLADEALGGLLLQLLEVGPGALPRGEQEGGAMAPASFGLEVVHPRNRRLLLLLHRLLAVVVLLHLVVVGYGEGARGCDPGDLRAEEVPLLAGEPRRGDHGAPQVARHEPLDRARGGDVASTGGGEANPGRGAACGDPVGPRVCSLALRLDVVLRSAGQGRRLRRALRRFEGALGHVVVAMGAQDLAPEPQAHQGRHFRRELPEGQAHVEGLLPAEAHAGPLEHRRVLEVVLHEAEHPRGRGGVARRPHDPQGVQAPLLPLLFSPCVGDDVLRLVGREGSAEGGLLHVPAERLQVR
mmetsp:Transcript_19551/g.39779  ORF Transcript_19551/g.39779 Transcript_19551/m.39779 type:complete len:340 (+) Transcript_19551:526-1545(+)